jgi:hypothetical protein
VVRAAGRLVRSQPGSPVRPHCAPCRRSRTAPRSRPI